MPSSSYLLRFTLLAAVFALGLTGCSVTPGSGLSSAISEEPNAAAAAPLAGAPALNGTNSLAGDLTPVRDPAMARSGSTLYLFSTDTKPVIPGGFLPIRCSADDGRTWAQCGHVFTTIPAWLTDAMPGLDTLWAPDVSYFGGLWHVYYAASSLLSQNSAIGVATSPTLDPKDPSYGWTDGGQIIASQAGSDFNAIDPNIVLDENGTPFLNFGSFWKGLYQQAVDNSGKLISGAKRYHIAYKPSPSDHPIEASSILQHNGYYYLFASTGHCCASTVEASDYQEIVGRSKSPHGLFVDEDGKSLMNGGGTVLVSAGDDWFATGSATAFHDASTGRDLLAFHALQLSKAGAATLWIKNITWQNDWPVLETF